MFRNWFLLIAIAVTASALALSSPAHANLVIDLDDGAGNSITIADEGGFDTFAGAGVVSWSGSLGVWNVNVTTGQSDPVLGTKADPNLDLNSVNTSTSGAASTMTVMMTDTDFTVAAIGELVDLLLEAGGTTSGTIAFDLWIDDNNAEFGMGELITSSVLLGPGAFSSTTSGTGTANDAGLLYSITLVAVVDHAGSGSGQTTSFDVEITRIPEPATLAIFGAGLIMLGGLVRKRRRATA